MNYANPKHVEIVKQGTAAIWKWQQENPAMRLDLTGADLSGAFLSEAFLQKALLGNPSLHRTDLGALGRIQQLLPMRRRYYGQ